MKNHKARQIAKASTAHTAQVHQGKGMMSNAGQMPTRANSEPSPANSGTAEDFMSSTGQPINYASISQTASYPPRNSGNPGNN